MENYIGIDLGTTNSAICSYDADQLQTRVWPSPEGSDVTPSAIYIDRRGNQYIGQRAYNQAPRSPDNCATLFKRFMGTTVPIELSTVNRTLTPEECSAEILKTLFGYLPEEIRNSPDIGTVITVPAAFNQLQKNATMAAAEMAGIGKVELVQEPVVAAMSYMHVRGTDGIFLIYDLSDGTLDIAIAESIRKRINILAHGGIQMCGGRDFDRALVDNLVRPWLHENFELPNDFATNPNYKSLLRLATWATERAKIELSAKDETMISLSEDEIHMNDLNGDEIYLDIPLQREFYNDLIVDRVNDTIHAARETLSKTGYTPNDVERIVWVGGPTHYKPLRDKVAFELGITGDLLAVNPMTAVAEGASIFADAASIEFENKKKPEDQEGQTSQAGTSSTVPFVVTFNATEETPDDTSRIAIKVEGQVPPGYVFQIDGLDEGWTSGRLSLQHGEIVNVNLTKPGENTFKASVYDTSGTLIKEDEVVIRKLVAIVEGIPASHPIVLEVVEKIGGRSVPEYVVKEHDKLPKRGTTVLRAGESIEAGSDKSLNFKLWEGKIHDIIADNRPISVLKIKGTDFPEGTIPVDAELHCTYEVPSGGNIKFEVKVEIEGVTRKFGGVYNYRLENLNPVASQVAEEGVQTRKRIDDLQRIVDDNPKLEQAANKIESSILLDPEESDRENLLGAYNANLEAKVLLFEVREENRKEIRQSDLNNIAGFFDRYIRQHARPSEETAFDNLKGTAQRSIENNDRDFEDHLGELSGRNFQILWRQDWFVIEEFKHLANLPAEQFEDSDRFEMLVEIGQQLLGTPEIQEILSGRREATIRSEAVDQLRGIIIQLMEIRRVGGTSDQDRIANVLINRRNA